MIPLRKACSAAGLAMAAVLLFIFFTLFFFPERLLLEAVNRVLAAEGLSLTTASFHKSLPLGLAGKGWQLSSARGELLKLERAAISLKLLPLFAGQLRVSLVATIGGGRVDGEISLRQKRFCRLDLNRIQLEQIPFFATVAGTQAAGMVDAKLDLSGSGLKTEGYLKLDARGVDLRGIKLGETPLPDAAYQTVQGMLRFGKGSGQLESLTLQGDGLYARLKGSLPLTNPLSAAPLNLTLELMPKPELLEKQKFVFLLLTKYLDTPGHYQLPIRGTLGKPLLQ